PADNRDRNAVAWQTSSDLPSAHLSSPSRPFEYKRGLQPQSGCASAREGRHRLRIDDVGLIRFLEDRPLLEPRELSDLEFTVFSAHEVDQIVVEGIANVVAERRRGEHHHIPGTDLVRFVPDLRETFSG